MGGLSSSNQAEIVTTNARWSSAAVGQVSGSIKYTVPDGAVLALITTNKPIYVAQTGSVNVYDEDATTASQNDGVLLGINEGAVADDSPRGIHEIPVSGGGYLHVKDAGARATIHCTFLIS